MPRQTHLLRNLFLLVLTTIAGGTVGYVRLEEGWSFFDAFYMTVITLTTIGFTEVHELSDGGRVFTIVLIVCGLGAAATFVTQFAQVMVESNLRDLWRKRRMEKQLAGLKDHVIICGYGRIGEAIGQDLRDAGVTCVVIDGNEERIAAARAAGLQVMIGNATSDVSLVSAGIGRASVLVAALSQDSDNVFVALAARDLNRDIVVIARAEDRSLETRMLRAGVNRVVCPAYLGGGQIARMIGQDLGLGERIGRDRRATDVLGYELFVYRNLHGRPLCVSEILELAGAHSAVAVVPAVGERVADPPSDAVVEDGDAAVLLVDRAETSARRDTDVFELAQGTVTGIPAVDEEHEQIFTMIRRLATVAGDDEHKVVRQVLEELRVYTQRHFAHEEKLFLASAYPDAERHLAQHREFTHKVDLMLGEREYVHRANVANMLEEWIVQHILEMDKGYVEHLQVVSTM